MRHYGDICKIHGWDVEPVDVITGGSPCQDLSVAGKRAGLAGERSGLFMEQMRIIKEMRESDRAMGRTGIAIRPRYMVWENVPGAFSSGKQKGADFAAVIEEIIKVCEPGADVYVPVPEKGWTKSGCYYADDGSWSIAWRLHDAQFWGVPQRRKRISLVADFGGLSAPEILFERKGLSGNPQPGGAQGKRTAAGAEGGAGGAVYGIDQQGGKGNASYTEGVAPTLAGDSHGTPHAVSFHLTQDPIPQTGATPCLSPGNPNNGQATIGVAIGVDVYNQTVTGEITAPLTAACGDSNTSGPKVIKCGNPWDTQSERVYCGDGAWHSLNGNENGGQSRDAVLAFAQNQRGEERDLGDKGGALAAEHGMQQQTYIFDARGNGNGQLAPIITGDHQNRVTDYTALCINGEVAPSLVASAYKGPGNTQDGMAVITFDKEMYNAGEKMRGEPQARYDDVAPTVRADTHPSGVCTNVVRRLTPLECERLQGYPDGWTDIGEWIDSKGKKHKDADSPRYKALGNSIALPYWEYLARRICAQYERPVRMASLFDGIWGFPLAFSRAGAVPVWASEIEEFPIAVTKLHFSEAGGHGGPHDGGKT